jgi:hypothetical protein
LTKAQLREIGIRRNAGDVPALLWKIKRLRAIVLRVDQLQRVLGSLGGGAGVLLAALQGELQGEPCVVEQERLPGHGEK